MKICIKQCTGVGAGGGNWRRRLRERVNNVRRESDGGECPEKKKQKGKKG